MKILSLEKLRDMKLSDIITSKIVRFIWVAKDDPVTCELCRSLSGQIIDANDNMYGIYQPPVHIHCRCIWKPLLSDAKSIPEPNFVQPSNDLITKFGFLWFLIPFKGKKKGPLEISPFNPESLNPKFEPSEVWNIQKNIEEQMQNNIDITKEKVKDNLVNNIISVIFIGKKGQTVLDKEFEIDSSFDLTIREDKLVKEKAVAYIMNPDFESSNVWELEIKKKYKLKNKF